MQDTLFSYRTIHGDFENAWINHTRIDKILDEIFEDYSMGNWNFFTLLDAKNNHFLQASILEGLWQTEYSRGDGSIYRIELSKQPNSLFYSFLNKEKIEIDTWQRIRLEDL